MRFAYADPPYPGLAARYYADQPTYAGEVDHAALVASLEASGYDGWALSTAARLRFGRVRSMNLHESPHQKRRPPEGGQLCGIIVEPGTGFEPATCALRSRPDERVRARNHA